MPKPNTQEVFAFCSQVWTSLMQDPKQCVLDTPSDELVIEVIIQFYDGNVHSLSNAKKHVNDFFKKLHQQKA